MVRPDDARPTGKETSRSAPTAPTESTYVVWSSDRNRAPEVGRTRIAAWNCVVCSAAVARISAVSGRRRSVPPWIRLPASQYRPAGSRFPLINSWKRAPASGAPDGSAATGSFCVSGMEAPWRQAVRSAPACRVPMEANDCYMPIDGISGKNVPRLFLRRAARPHAALRPGRHPDPGRPALREGTTGPPTGIARRRWAEPERRRPSSMVPAGGQGASGCFQRSSGKRAKSLSVLTSSHPCSIARAAR